MGGVPFAFAQAVVAPVQVVVLPAGSDSSFWMKWQCQCGRLKNREPLAPPCGSRLGAGFELLLAALGGLHHLAHAQAPRPNRARGVSRRWAR